MSNSAERYEFLDALRGLAALIVLVFHRRWFLPGGELTDMPAAGFAVDFFFLLSGFVIAHAYAQRLVGGMSVARFAMVRAIRLYPLLILGGLLGVIPALLSADPPNAGAVLANLLALPAPQSLGEAQPFFLNQPVWSLYFELMVNLAYALTARFLGMRALVVIAGLSGAALVIVAFTLGSNVGHEYGTLWAAVPRCVFPFTVGLILHRLHVEGRLPRLQLGPVTISAVLVLALVAPVPWDHELHFLTCVMALFPLVLMAGANVRQTRYLKIATLLGAISYPVYILHMPLYALIEPAWFAARLPAWPYVPVLGSLIAGLSWAALKIYDEPLRRWLTDLTAQRRKDRLTSRPAP